MRTTPDDVVPEPYDETAIQSIDTCLDSARVGHHHDCTLEHTDEQEFPPS